MSHLLPLITLSIFAAGCFYLAVGTTLESSLTVYNVPQTVSQYLYQTNIPAMSQATICMWYKGVEDDDSRKSDWLISVSKPSGKDDNLAIGTYGADRLSFYIDGQSRSLSAFEQGSAEALWLGWNKHCFTWKSSGNIAWYSDRETSGLLELIATTGASSNVMHGSGFLVVFQEQDSYGGDFDLDQTAYGGIAWLNIWNFEMKEAELNALGCMDTGNVASMDSLQISGTIEKSSCTFPCNDGEWPWLRQEKTESQQVKVFCVIHGASLKGHVIFSETANTITSCAMLCLSESKCLSANYNKSTGECVLNRDVHSCDMQDFSRDLSAELVYITSKECY